MDQIQTSSSSGGLLHFFFGREIAAKLQSKCSMLPATPDEDKGMNVTNNL